MSTDPAAAKDVVLAERPLISDETDLIEPTLLDELICHISSLASVYHKPPNSFVDGAKMPIKSLMGATGAVAAPVVEESTAQQNSVIPSQESYLRIFFAFISTKY